MSIAVPQQETDQRSKFFYEALDRLHNAPKTFFTEEEGAALAAIDEAMGGAVYFGDPEGRYPNKDFND